MSSQTLNIILSLQDRASKELKEFESKTKNLHNSFKKMAQAGTIGFGVLSGAIIKSALDTNVASSTIVKATGASGDALDDMLKSARQISKFVPQSMEEIAGVMGEVNTRLNVTDDVLEDATDAFLKFSRVTGTDSVDAVRNVTRLMQDWGIETKDTISILDQLVKASQMTGVSVDDLSNTMVNYGVQLRALGFSQAESIALLSKFEKEGVSTEKMVGGLSIALGKLANEGIDDTAQGFRELIRRIEETESVGDATRVAIEMLGMRAGPDFALAVLEGRFAIEDYIHALENADGALNETAGNSIKLTENLLILKNSFLASIAPTDEFQSKIVEVTNKVIDFVTENQELVRIIVYAGTIIFGAIAVIGSIGLAFLAVTKYVLAFKGVLQLLGIGFGGLVLAVLKVGLIILGLILIVKNVIEIFNILKNDMDLVWEGIQATFKEAVDYIINNPIKALIESLEHVLRLLDRVAGFGGVRKVVSSIASRFQSGKSTPVNDAIISPRGDIITTHPDDYLIATKTPHSLGGGLNLTITGNTFMGEEDVAERIGDQIMKTLHLNMKMG